MSNVLKFVKSTMRIFYINISGSDYNITNVGYSLAILIKYFLKKILGVVVTTYIILR